MLWSLAVTFVLSALKESVKNPEKKAAIRSKMLEVAEWIQAVFGEDPLFQSVQKSTK